jgi:archaeal chaperonin
MKENLQENFEILESSIQAIENLAAAVKHTVGPKGLDVMLVDEYGSYKCSNDGVEILSSMQIKHPVSKLAVEVARSQEARVGDGTTSAVIFTEAILKIAFKKIKKGAKVQRLIKGLECAAEEAFTLLEKSSFKLQGLDDEKLLQITKIAARGQEELASFLIAIIKKIKSQNKKDFDYDLSEYIFPVLRSQDRIIEGYLLKKKPHFIYDQKFSNIEVLLIEGLLEPEAMPVEAIATSEGLKKYESHVQILLETAKKLIKVGIRGVFSSASIMPKLEELFLKEGVFVLSHLTKNELNKIKILAGGQLLTREKLISLDIESIKEFSASLTKLYWDEDLQGNIIQGSKNKVVSLILSSETQVALDEKTRIAIDAAKSMKSALAKGYVLGEGLAEMNIIPDLQRFRESQGLEDISFLAGLESLEEALEALFTQILENAGIRSLDYKTKIKFSSENRQGIDLDNLEIIDLLERGILDPLELKHSALKIAIEIASQVLRINRVLQAK